MRKISIKTQLKQALEQLEHKDKSIDDMRMRIYELEHEQDKKRMREDFYQREMGFRSEIERLFEIIRWQIKPTTADDPFNVAKQEEARTINFRKIN